MNIADATHSYEKWMRSCVKVIESHLRLKHEQMRTSPFAFLRGSYYRWAEQWPKICSDLCHCPLVPAVGDLHVDSFGTWRDGEGRLCWGVDDFDESYPLPYTNDLVRLATSLRLVIDSGHLGIKFRTGCDAILEGYRSTLRDGGRPIVLAEDRRTLLELGIDAIKPPDNFWGKIDRLPVPRRGAPADAKRALRNSMPKSLKYKIVSRQAGLGSLGQQRYVAVGTWEGGQIAREAKLLVPSASVWLKGHGAKGGQNHYESTMKAAIRSHDPFQRVAGRWLIRRLSPDSNPIYIEDLPRKRDDETLLSAMGSETANVHLGKQNAVNTILRDLNGKKSNWLRSAAKQMAATSVDDWKAIR